MPGVGTEYVRAVAEIAGAIAPNATVTTTGWIDRDQGRRSLEVCLSGISAHGSKQLNLIDCLDWKQPVGNVEVDMLASRRQAQGALYAMICSNSGYTQFALRKAEKLGILLTSATVDADGRIRIQQHRLRIAERITPTLDALSLTHPPIASLGSVQRDSAFVALDGLSVGDWVAHLARRLFREHPAARRITFDCQFTPSRRWTIDGILFAPSALQVVLGFQRNPVCQPVIEHVEGSLLDQFQRRASVPRGQVVSLNPLNNQGWQELDREWSRGELAPASGEFECQLLRELPQAGHGPDVDSLIIQSSIACE